MRVDAWLDRELRSPVNKAQHPDQDFDQWALAPLATALANLARLSQFGHIPGPPWRRLSPKMASLLSFEGINHIRFFCAAEPSNKMIALSFLIALARVLLSVPH